MNVLHFGCSPLFRAVCLAKRVKKIQCVTSVSALIEMHVTHWRK